MCLECPSITLLNQSVGLTQEHRRSLVIIYTLFNCASSIDDLTHLLASDLAGGWEAGKAREEAALGGKTVLDEELVDGLVGVWVAVLQVQAVAGVLDNLNLEGACVLEHGLFLTSQSLSLSRE